MTAQKNNKIFENYEVGNLIGTGRFAEVFEATKRDLGQKVALKILRPEWYENATVRDQFIKQARAIARLKHPRVVDVLDLGEESGRTFMALEFLSGGDLLKWQKSFEQKHPPLLQIITIVDDVASALDFLHSRKENEIALVHGDVKPGNILLEEDLHTTGRLRAKLSDLGMLYAMQKATTGTTVYPQSAPWYISPEQASDLPPTPFSDQYALGVVTYEMLTGHVPFTAESVTTVYRQHKNEIPKAPSTFNPDLPEEIDKILLKVLAKDPAARYADCSSFAKLLRLAVEATEEKKFRSLLEKARDALATGNPEPAINALKEANQIKPDAPDVNILMEKAQKIERAVQNYQEASDLLKGATQQAEKIRAEVPEYPDKDDLLSELAPLPPNIWRASLQRWRRALITFTGLMIIFILSGLGGKIYTAIMPANDSFRLTLVPLVWTDTATPTLTFTPTITFTPTFTPTNTPTPTPPILDTRNQTPIAILNRLVGHSNYVRSVAFSPDGTLLASGSADTTIRIWSVTNSQLIQTLEGHTSTVNSVAFSPDGSRLASGSGDNTIRIWSVTSGQMLQTLKGDNGDVNSVAFSPDGSRLASGSTYRTIRIWNVYDGQLLQTLEGHRSDIRSVAFSPDGSLLASVSDSADTTIRIWSVTSGQLLQTLESRNGPVWSVAFSPDGWWLASGSDEWNIILWGIPRWNTTPSPTATTTQTPTITPTSTNTPTPPVLGSGFQSPIAILNRLVGHSVYVRSVAFSLDGSLLASGSADSTIRIWNINNGQLLQTLEDLGVICVAFSPDGSLLASGSGDSTIRIWSVTNGQLLQTLEGHTSTVNSVAFSPDGSLLASGSGDSTTRIWSVTSGQLLQTLKDHNGAARSVAFSPDGSLLASGSEDKTIRIWSVTSGQLLQTLEGHTSRVYSVAFSPAGSLLASGSGDNTIRIWSVTSGQLLQTLEGHNGSVRSVAFSSDGSVLASGSGDKTIRIWSVTSGQLLQTLEGSNGSVWSVAFSPDGWWLASGSDDRNIILWGIPRWDTMPSPTVTTTIP